MSLKERDAPWSSDNDCVRQNSWIVDSESETERRNLSSRRRPRTRRNENSARASLNPDSSARVTSRYVLRCFNESISSLTTVIAAVDDGDGDSFWVCDSEFSVAGGGDGGCSYTFEFIEFSFWRNRNGIEILCMARTLSDRLVACATTLRCTEPYSFCG